AIHPSGSWLYTTSINTQAIYAFSIDAGTGALTPLPSSPLTVPGFRPADIILDPAARFAFVTNNASFNIATFSVNSTTGQLALVGSPVAAGRSPVWQTTDASGTHLYVGDDVESQIYAYNIGTTGALTPLTPPTFSSVSSPEIPALSPNGKFLYVPGFSAP